MALSLQRVRDEAEALEREAEGLWPTPTLAHAELERGSRELARLRAEIRELDGPERHRVSLFATSFVMTFLSLMAFAGWLIASGR